MGYECIVCVKQVPDTARVTGEAMKADGTLNRAALPTVFNPDDLHALEAALSIRDRWGGRVTAVAMGPLGATDVLRDCLYRGADRVILLNDRRAAGSDTLATSYILSEAIKKIGRYDFVFCGQQAIDGDTAQVGPQLAEKLGVAQVTYFERIVEFVRPSEIGARRDSRTGDTVRLRRNMGSGWEVLEARLPLLVTVLDTANEPRPPAAKRMMQYKRARSAGEVEREVAAESKVDAKRDSRTSDAPRRSPTPQGRFHTEEERDAERQQAGSPAARIERLKMRNLLIEQWDLDDVGADLRWCGIAGSPTKVHRVQSIVLTKEGYTEVLPTQQGIQNMIHELIVDHTLG